MSETVSTDLVRKIHAAPTRLVLAVNGGSQAIADLLVEPGGSRTLLEAVVPYSTAALEQWLGGAPENFCSAKTARAMAMAAFLRARRLADDSTTEADLPLSKGAAELAGVACTASLVSNRPKQGPHRIHVASQTASTTSTYSVELVKGRRDRAGEEDVATRITLKAIAEACGLAERLPLDLESAEHLILQRTIAPAEWQNLLLGRVSLVQQNATPALIDPSAGSGEPRVIFPGAFNPLHDGHRRMAQMAKELLGMPVEFEISIENVDKPPLDFTEMADRAAQFNAGEPLWFTRAATFQRKSELFARATFVVGADTILRIADPRYYGGNPTAAISAIERIAARGARFLVFGRVSAGQFQTLGQLKLPPQLLALCQEIPPERFRADLSSTELRRSTFDRG